MKKSPTIKDLGVLEKGDQTRQVKKPLEGPQPATPRPIPKSLVDALKDKDDGPVSPPGFAPVVAEFGHNLVGGADAKEFQAFADSKYKKKEQEQCEKKDHKLKRTQSMRIFYY